MHLRCGAGECETSDGSRESHGLREKLGKAKQTTMSALHRSQTVRQIYKGVIRHPRRPTPLLHVKKLIAAYTGF